jgi:DNA repair exonuclease SbcCD ATPase subunit
MHLLSARLHPFGALVDRTYSLDSGLQTLLGPNEFGKSTFREAVIHALFTPTNLTPAKLRDTIGRWFPLPSATSAAVTLRFSKDGKVYTVEKRWGASSQSILSSDDGTHDERDPLRVQERLAELVIHDEATYRRILFTSQDEMARTITDLREGGLGLVSRAAAAAAGARQVAGDVDLEAMATQLRAEVEDAYGRWDIARREPVREAKSGQGSVSNPWKRGVGAVLESWYGWQRAVVDVADRRQFDSTLDALTGKLRNAKSEVSLLEPVVRSMEVAVDALAERQALASRLDAVRQRMAAMRDVDRDWGAAEVQVPLKRQQLEEKEAQSVRLEQELAGARRRAQASVARAQLTTIRAAESELDGARIALQASKSVEQSDLKRVQALETGLREVEISIDAQKLAATVMSDRTTTASISSGAELPETFELAAGKPLSLEASGQVRISLEGVSVTVKSGLADVDALLASRAAALSERAAELQRLGCDDLGAVVAAQKMRADAASKVAMCEQALKSARQGKSADDWEREEREIADLPACRDESAIQAELAPLRESIGEIRADVRRLEGAVAGWTRDWGDRVRLGDALLDARDEERKTKSDLDALPAPGGGATDLAAMRHELRGKKDALERARAQAGAAEVEIAALADPGEVDLEALHVTASEREAQFKRELASAEAKQRIIDAIEALRDGVDPFARLSTRVEELFCELTLNAYSKIEGSEGLPTAVIRSNQTVIPAERLSIGAAVSLSLAVRIALAENTLAAGPAILLLDDPLVDLDAERRRHATRLLARLGERMQVVILTCHNQHADELGSGRLEVRGV